jgi:hypothetical protein
MSNLSHQFDGMAEAYEEQQRRRFARRHESGFVGNGYWYANYPGMVGAIGAGTITQTQSEQYENPTQELAENLGQTASDTSGMGEGGTAASATGAAGGSPA